jgi:hypothetical protein
VKPCVCVWVGTVVVGTGLGCLACRHATLKEACVGVHAFVPEPA